MFQLLAVLQLQLLVLLLEGVPQLLLLEFLLFAELQNRDGRTGSVRLRDVNRVD